jgi:uncharacterized protein (TIGR00369 family)
MLPPDEHFRRLERMYYSAPINKFFQPTIRISEAHAEIALTVRPDFFHAAHALHGSVYFKSLDDAAFFAVSSVVLDVFIVTVTYNVVLLRPVTDGLITAFGRVVHSARNLMVAEAELRDSANKPLARGSGTFMRSTTALGPEVGYA